VVPQPNDLPTGRVGGGEVSGRLLRAPAWDALLKPVYGEGGPGGCSLRVPGRRGRLSPFFPLRKPEPGRPPEPRWSREADGPKYFSNFASCSSLRSPRSFSLSFSVEARMRGRSSSNVNFISSRLALNADSTVAACLSVSLRSRWMRFISQFNWPSVRDPGPRSAFRGPRSRGNARGGLGAPKSTTKPPVTTPAAKMTTAASMGFQAFTTCTPSHRTKPASPSQSRSTRGRLFLSLSQRGRTLPGQ